MILLPTGKVLIIGGEDEFTAGRAVSSVDLYDVHANKWTTVGQIKVPKSGSASGTFPWHTASLLSPGRVLVVGTILLTGTSKYLSVAGVYDLRTGRWIDVSNSGMPRSQYTATVLPNGQVLIAGGRNPTGPDIGWLSSAELYIPAHY
jgi:hypothetical protein